MREYIYSIMYFCVCPADLGAASKSSTPMLKHTHTRTLSRSRSGALSRSLSRALFLSLSQGELIKKIGSGAGWGWLVRFGDIEGTFRTREVFMLAYVSPAETADTTTAGGKGEGHGASSGITSVDKYSGPSAGGGGGGGVGGGVKMSIGWSEGEEGALSARTPRWKLCMRHVI
jgi:hypothetical protein